MKKNPMTIVLMTLCLSAYAEDFDVLNGIWKSYDVYDYVTSHPQSSIDYKGRRMRHPSNAIEIKIQSDGTGSYSDDGLYFDIKRAEQYDDNGFVLYLDDSLYELVITLINEDSFFVTYWEEFTSTGPVYENPWYRVSGSAKIPVQYGIMNDTRVRLRTKPNLESDTWGFFNTGDEVTILDKSAETQKIGDMEDYWYKVRTDNFPDGWVYGAFIDIEE